MGWFISLGLLIGTAFAKGYTFTGDAILIASALFAIAGSLGGAANIIVNAKNKLTKSNEDKEE